MRNLIELAAGVSARRKPNPDSKFRLTFQFVSSLSAVGKYPSVHGGEIEVLEKQFDIDSALPNGHGGAKVVCERVEFELVFSTFRYVVQFSRREETRSLDWSNSSTFTPGVFTVEG